MQTNKDTKLPTRVIDAHHHFVDTRPAQDGGNGDDFQAFLASLLPNEVYFPGQYYMDVVKPLAEKGVTLAASVHIECMPNDGAQEVAWVESFTTTGNDDDKPCTVQGMVASCDLSSPTVEDDLQKIMAASPTGKVKGIRWILDCIGKFEPNTATHVGTKRHDGIDYLRGSHGPDTYDGTVVPDFERGFALLEKYNLSFDLQCAPVQLHQAAELCKRHPEVLVCIDHFGKPRTVLGPDKNDDETINPNTVPDAQDLEDWRAGMKVMSECSNVYVKLSMIGYAIPGWIRTPERRALMQTLVREVLDMFGPQRCMMAWNWWKNGAVSDSDFLSDVGPTPLQYLEFMAACLEPYTPEEQDRVYYGTAAEFYKLSI